MYVNTVCLLWYYTVTIGFYLLICFRARPVIHLTKEFKVEPKIVDPNECLENKPW